jgi:hypothetical protein
VARLTLAATQARNAEAATKETGSMKPLKVDSLERKQMLHFTALKNSNANEIRKRMEAGPLGGQTDAYINEYQDGTGEFYRYEASFSAMYVTLQNQRHDAQGAALSDAELNALPTPPAWLDDRSIALPPESADDNAWTKYVKTYAKDHGSTDDHWNNGLDMLVDAVKAGDPSP